MELEQKLTWQDCLELGYYQAFTGKKSQRLTRRQQERRGWITLAVFVLVAALLCWLCAAAAPRVLRIASVLIAECTWVLLNILMGRRMVRFRAKSAWALQTDGTKLVRVDEAGVEYRLLAPGTEQVLLRAQVPWQEVSSVSVSPEYYVFQCPFSNFAVKREMDYGQRQELEEYYRQNVPSEKINYRQ